MIETKKSILAIIGGVSLTAFSAFAQEAETPKAESWMDRESLFITPAVKEIASKNGFTPSITWIGEAWDNVSGGSKTGSVYDSLFTIGFEQDVSKLAGKDGWGTFGITAFWYAQSKRQGDWWVCRQCRAVRK